MMAGYCPNRDGDCYKMYDPINNVIYYSRDVTWMKRMYFPKVDALGIRIDWLGERINNFISGRRQQRRKKRRIMPASEAGENDDYISLVAGDDDDGEDANDENQNHRCYSNPIDPEMIDFDVSMSGEYVNDDNKDDQYYNTSEILDDKGMDEDGNNVTEDEYTFEDESMEEVSDDNSNESDDDQPTEEKPRLRTQSGRASVPYDHNRKVGSRTMSRPAEFDADVNGLLLFTKEHIPFETQFFNTMTELGEY